MGFERFQLADFKLGWVVGNFEPALLQSSEIEVAVKHFKRGDVEPSHKQLVATEITIVISGEIRLGDNVYGANEIIRIPPGIFADFESLTDSSLVCIKYPSLPNDKILE
jgi:hypothetical protein